MRIAGGIVNVYLLLSSFFNVIFGLKNFVWYFYQKFCKIK